MNTKKLSLLILSTAILSFPFSAYAFEDIPTYMKIFKKIERLTHLENFLEPETIPTEYSALSQKIQSTNNNKAVFASREIIDTYSGIRINIEQELVSFSYLSDKEPNIIPIEQADTISFKLIETGTYIIATDKNAVYIIIGNQYQRLTSLNPESLIIIRNQQTREIEYLNDGEKTFSISELI